MPKHLYGSATSPKRENSVFGVGSLYAISLLRLRCGGNGSHQNRNIEYPPDSLHNLLQ